MTKRKTLPENLQEIINSNNMDLFKSVFDKCEISATRRGKTLANVFTFDNLTEKHVLFLIENGIDLNADSGSGYTPCYYLADNLDLLKLIIKHGADIEHITGRFYNTPLFDSAWTHKVQAVKNLLKCGANPEPRGGINNNTALDESLECCSNGDIINTLQIAKDLLNAGAKPSSKTKQYVKKIGENFEFYRLDFNSDLVDKYSEALDKLYTLFDVEPVPKRKFFDGSSPITVKSDTWQKQFNELWNLLVPARGHANTIQGEVIRIVGKVSHELLDNGGINWSKEYRNLVLQLLKYFQTFDGIITEKACMLAGQISLKSDESLLDPLAFITVKWVLEHNNPVPLQKVDYRL